LGGRETRIHGETQVMWPSRLVCRFTSQRG
jgi:hypothetical protein